MLQFLLFFFFLSAPKVFSQSCYSSDCKTCVSDSYCYYYVQCGSCTSSSSYTCRDEYPVRNCPAYPVWPTVTQLAASRSSVYGTLGLSALAIVCIAIMAYSPIEQICGSKVSPTFQGYNCSNHLLFFAACFLWVGLALGLAAPALPWIVSFTTSSSSYSSGPACFITAFAIELCSVDSSTFDILCVNRYTFSEVLSPIKGGFYTPNSTQLSYIQNALLLGSLGYVVSVGLLLPCAIMTSIALYRYNRLIKYGIPAYTSGCSLASLSVAQMIGWPAFGIFIIVIGSGVQLSSTATKYLRANGIFSNAEYIAMPGSVAGGVSIFMQLVGLALASIAAKALQKVKGVGCNTGGCCKLAMANDDEDEESPQQNKVVYERSSLLRSQG